MNYFYKNKHSAIKLTEIKKRLCGLDKMKIHVRAFPECVRPLSRESAKFSASDSSDVSEPDDKSESSSDDSSSSLSSSSLFIVSKFRIFRIYNHLNRRIYLALQS